MAKQEFHLDFCGRGITVETGEIAKQADGAVIIRYGDTVTLSTACASNTAKEGIDFFPLTVSLKKNYIPLVRFQVVSYVVKEDQANMQL